MAPAAADHFVAPTTAPMSPNAKKSEDENMERKEYIRIFVETYDGQTLKLDMEKDSSIRDLKGELCHEHGYFGLFWEHRLLDENGNPLDDLSTFFQLCGVNNVCTLQLKKQKGRARKRLARGPASLDPLRLELQEEAASSTSTLGARSSEEELVESIKSSSEKALTSGGCHATEPFAVQKVRSKASLHQAREARKLTQQKATASHADNDSTKQPAQPDLATMVSMVVQNMLPDFFVQCSPSKAKNPSWGGA